MVLWTLHSLFHFQSCLFDALFAAPFFSLEPSEGRVYHVLAHACFSLLSLSKSIPSSSDQRSVEARLEWRLERMGRLHGDRIACAESRADLSRAPDGDLAHDAESLAADDSLISETLSEDAL